MKPKEPAQYDSFNDALADVEETPEGDLWFLPGPIEEEPDYLPPGPRAESRETAVLSEWRKAEAGNAARLARVAGRLGALDDRLKRGPEGWRHRLALIEAADLSWFVGDRIGPDRPALWISMRLSSVQDDTAALARVGWAMRRHQFRIDRWAASMAVEGFKLVADRAEVQQPVDPAQQMIGGDVILDAEPVKQHLLNLLPTHHRLILQPV